MYCSATYSFGISHSSLWGYSNREYRALFKAMSYRHTNFFYYTTNLRNCIIVFDSSALRKWTRYLIKRISSIGTPILICLKKLIHTLFVFVCFFQQIKIGSAFTTLEEFVVGKVYVPLTKRNATTICVGGAVQQSTYLQTVFYKIYEN